MFDRLGHAIARKPRLFVLGWVLILILGSLSALWGFGSGNLFSRMKSTQSMVPNTESDTVLQKTIEKTSPESAVIVVSGVTPSQVTSEVAHLRAELERIDGVTSVVDPESVAAKFAKGAQAAIDNAIATALAENEAQVQAAVQEAISQAEPQIQQAVNLAIAQFRQQHPGVSPDAVAAQARAEATAQVETRAREAATAQIKEQARSAATKEIEKQANPADSLRSKDGFVISVEAKEGSAPTDAILSATASFEHAIQQVNSQAHADVSSRAVFENIILDIVKKDLMTGEAIGMPIALFLLVVVFGGIIAAGLPLVGAVTSIAIGMGLLWVITHVTNVDTFVLNIVSIIGLALSIDYGLLIVSRYREEVANELARRNLDDASAIGDDISDLVASAVTTTVSTAGRTVSFSALTIAFAISGLLFMEAPMLRMIGLGGIIVTMLAVATAVMMVPAMITLLGRRLVRPSRLSRVPGVRTLVKKVGDSASDDGVFSRLARWVHRRPWPILLAVTAVLLIMAAPIRDLSMRSNFMEYIPEHTSASRAYTAMQSYRSLATPSVTVIAQTNPENAADLVKYIQQIDSVAWVHDPAPFTDDETVVEFYMNVDDQVGPEVTKAVEDLRSFETSYVKSVGGPAALQLDFTNSIKEGAPVAAAVVALAVLILLFLMTGSVIAPIKALLINALSLVAGMGATVFVFENGLFGLPQTVGLETFVVATALAFGLGLAMDYEVFLIARIKEYWDAGYDNDTAVEKGLQRSGRIITSAAAIIVAVFIGFIFGDLLAIKQVGVALALIVIIDATLVRMLLVPATMTILGKWNWWAPRPLKVVYEKFKLVH
ncbi:Membrane transport protein mmpL8 [Trueperella pyogenes]|uniref:MMPL family transporter n=1 Tax=Trueperella pyogenes TaxID=1661 RepID=UPI000DF984F6|nr:MMPL family transporter [Trueperella pyogenes]MBB3024693.1 RND superfamily putative drug exporter [Trueperella pyogenes]SUO87354.1 Membrane transport protein mmpL8 [Trueperella pyogenes]